VNRKSNIASVSWPDHLVFGDGDGELDTVDGLRSRMEAWRDELGAAIVHWREVRTRRREARYYAAPGNPRTSPRKIRSIRWDDFQVAPQLAHEFGMKAQLYVSVLDEGRPLPSKRERELSFHNAMHAQHITWQTKWSRANPHYAMCDRNGTVRQWGVMCFAYPEVRSFFCKRIQRLLRGYDFDGVFLCLRSQARPADFADQFGFNEPIRRDYMQRYGRDILTQDFDVQRWRDLVGGYFTQFLAELRQVLSKLGLTLAVGVQRGDIIGPPLGNWTLQWREWVARDLIDELIIDQNSSRCPSMWHQLWPMYRGYGYLQNVADGYNVRPLIEDLDLAYGPALLDSRVNLYVARQWVPRSEEAEAELLAHPAVSGLVFSTFRHDNPEAIARGDFVA